MVKLHKFTAFHRKIMHKICGEKKIFTTYLTYCFDFFSTLGNPWLKQGNAVFLNVFKSLPQNLWRPISSQVQDEYCLWEFFANFLDFCDWNFLCQAQNCMIRLESFEKRSDYWWVNFPSVFYDKCILNWLNKRQGIKVFSPHSTPDLSNFTAFTA